MLPTTTGDHRIITTATVHTTGIARTRPGATIRTTIPGRGVPHGHGTGIGGHHGHGAGDLHGHGARHGAGHPHGDGADIILRHPYIVRRGHIVRQGTRVLLTA